MLYMASFKFWSFTETLTNCLLCERSHRNAESRAAHIPGYKKGEVMTCRGPAALFLSHASTAKSNHSAAPT